MANKVLTSRVEIEDFVRGATFFGTGGGGAYEVGVELLMEQLEAGRPIGWRDVDSLKDDEYTACPFGMGSLAPLDDKKREMMVICGLKGEGYNRGTSLAMAARELEEYTGKKLTALVTVELGGRQSASCIAAAANMGIFAVDGDYAGRAIPEIQQVTPYLKGRDPYPLATCDAWGNTCIIKKTVNWKMAERIGKMISVAAFTGTAMAGHLMNGKETKDTVLKGTLTESYEVGKLIRETRDSGQDPVAAVIKMLDGWLLGEGTTSDKNWYDKDGYFWGKHTITGERAFVGQKLEVDFQNENHAFWKNSKLLVTSPDMIIIVNAKTGEPYSNADLEPGEQVKIIGVRARKEFRTPIGLSVVGPHALGYEVKYIPIEAALKEE